MHSFTKALIIAAVLLLAGCKNEPNPPVVGRSNAATLLLINNCQNTAFLFIDTPKNPCLLTEAAPFSESEPMKLQDDLGNNIEDYVHVYIRMHDAEAVTERELFTDYMPFQSNYKHVFTVNEDYSVDYEMQSLY